MADISILARLLNGAVRNIDLSNNTPVVLSIKIGGSSSNTELTKAILDNLINLQNGSDVNASLHHHDGRYYTKTELNNNLSILGSVGSYLIGDENTYTNFTPTSNTVRGALIGIDTAIGNITGSQVKITSNDTSAGYLDAKVTVGVGTNVSNALEKHIINPLANEQLEIRFDSSKVDHGSLDGLGDDDHPQYILADGTRSFSGDQSMGGYRILNLGDPINSSDAATKQYVDNAIEGVKPKEAVRAATTAHLSSLAGNLTIDGVALTDGDRVLVKDQNTPADNGIYIVSSGSWNRAADFDQTTPINEIRGSYVAVMEGNTNAGKVFVCNSNVTNIGVDPITFVFFNSITTLNAGNGINITGTTISVDHDGQGLQFVSNQLSLELDGFTLSKSANGLKVADDGITSTQLANNAVTTNKIDDGAVTTVKIANNAVTEDKIATSAVGSGLTGGGGSALSVVHAPLIKKTMIAGESFAANQSFIVRFAKNSETAGRIYKADIDATTNDNFYTIGIALSATAVSAGNNIPVIMFGTHILGSSDSNFAAADVGKPVFLSSSGGFSTTAPNSPNQAVVKIGIVEDVDRIFVQPQVIGVL